MRECCKDMAEARKAGVVVAPEGSDGTYVYAVDAAGNRSGGGRVPALRPRGEQP